MSGLKSYDYLVVGLGVAGCSLGYRLEKAGKSVLYLNDSRLGSASQVAAGIINPITGRRYVKSWRIDELLPEAQSFYAELERELGVDLYFRLPLVRSLANRGESNNWLARTALPAYQDYLNDDPELGNIPTITHPAFGYAGIRQSARVDLAVLSRAWQSRVAAAGRLLDQPLKYVDLIPSPDGVTFDSYHFDRVVFCEGWRGRFNPWFGNLPHRGAKGEVLLARIDGPPLERMFKNRIFLVPRPDGDYWIGATTQNDYADDLPTDAGREWLLRELAALVKVPFKVEAHRAAVRPTVKDRRPLLGQHPTQKRLFIFNGLGTKGASLAPLMSRWLVDYLERKQEVPPEVKIGRFT